MKKAVSYLIAGVFLLAQAGLAAAQDASTFDVSAEIPGATGTSIDVSKVVKSGTAPNYTYTFTDWTHGTNLGFSTEAELVFNPEYGIWLPAYFFALDVSTTGGAGTPQVQVTYSNGTNPNGAAGQGLDYKGSATFVKVTGSGSSQAEENLAGPVRLGAVNNLGTFPSSQIAGGFMRIYLGIADGTETGANAPVPFTSEDASGRYSGTFVVTTTI